MEENYLTVLPDKLPLGRSADDASAAYNWLSPSTSVLQTGFRGRFGSRSFPCATTPLASSVPRICETPSLLCCSLAPLPQFWRRSKSHPKARSGSCTMPEPWNRQPFSAVITTPRMKLHHLINLIWGESDAVMAQMSWLCSSLAPIWWTWPFGALKARRVSGGRSRGVLGVLAQTHFKLADMCLKLINVRLHGHKHLLG